MVKTKQEVIFEDIYDIIKGDGENGIFYEDAKREIKKFVRNKNIEYDGIKNTISIGRDFKIKLLRKEDM